MYLLLLFRMCYPGGQNGFNFDLVALMRLLVYKRMNHIVNERSNQPQMLAPAPGSKEMIDADR